MKDSIEINQGYTMDYLIHGTFSLIAAGLAAVFSYILATCFLALAICFHLIQTGISVDIGDRKIRKFRSLLGRKFGKWVHVDSTDTLRLSLTDEAIRMNSRGASTAVRAKTYDLLLIKPDSDEVVIYEFGNYAGATKDSLLIAYKLDIHLDNQCLRHARHM